MMKKLLSASLFAAVALCANAYEVNDFVYTKAAKYKITGENLVKNGTFTEGTTGTDGWTAIDAVNYPLSTVFNRVEGGPDGTYTQKVLDGMTDLTAGMYQKIAIGAGGTYVVTLKVMGTAAGFTDLDMTGGNTNYINAYYNTDAKDSLATVDGTNLYYGTDGVSGGYQFSFDANGFTDVAFAVEAPADGNIMIDFRGLAAGLEVACVECHLAEAVYDDRVANERLAYIEYVLGVADFSEKETYPDLVEVMGYVKDGLASNATPEDMAGYMETLDGVWELFTEEAFSNVINLIPTTSGTAGSGNSSANWMNWTSKWNKLSSEYKSGAPWSWSTDRWSHKTAAADAPMAIQWMRGAGANSNWNNIATLTATLSDGTYFWGVTGQGGMMTLNKNRWARSWANECAETKLFFNGDTVLVDTLNPARNVDYIRCFTLDEDKEVTLGIICNNVSTLSENAGFDVQFYSPVLYKVLDGGLTPEQEAYLDAVQTQIEALAGRLEVAYGYLAETNDTLPWCKDDLKVGVDEAQARYDAWVAMSQDEILAMMDNEETLADTIMNNGVRFLNNNYITPFETLNTPLTNMPGAIESAQATLALRIYSGSAKKADLEAEIAASQSMYEAKLKVAFSTEDSLALVNQKAALEAMVVAFKEAITATTIVDIDFGTQEVPAVFVEHVDPEGLTDTYYTVDGAMGTMTATNVAAGYGTTSFEIGYGSSNDENNLAIRTDSLGMLRVGNGEAVVNFTGAPVKESDIVNIKFDLYVGNLKDCYNGYKVLTAEGDTICGLYFSKYSGVDNLNTFGVNYNSNIAGVGSSASSNAAIAAESNKTSFDIVLDFGAKVMYGTTSGSRGTYTSEQLPLPALVPAQFVLYSNYSNTDRRSWFDNLKVLNIAAGPVTGIENVTVGGNKVVGNGAMYNILGQRILKPVKGQLYIQDGVKKIAK